MSVDPTTIISMIEQCVKIYDYIEAVKESSEERRRFMQEVAALRDVLVNLQGLLRDEAFTQDRSSMAPLELLFDPTKPFIELIGKDLGKLEQKLRGGMKKNRTGWRSLLTKMVAAGIWPLDKAESDALFARLERHKSLISLALQHDVDQLIREVLDIAADNKGKLSEVTKAVAELIKVIGVTISYEERRKVAEWISNVSFSAYHAENSRKWLKGTGCWVLESPQFQTWASRTSLSPTLWCYGDAGAGKSVAAAMIVEHLRSIPENVVLVIVCRYNQNREYFRETHTFMCSLLRQLLRLEPAPNVPPYLLDLYREDIHPSEDCVRTILLEAARIIKRPIFIVLDALDECPLGFKLVAAIQRLGHDFNLLITSRPVFSQIEKYPSLHIRATDRDILAVIDDRIPALPYVREDQDLQTTVRTEVVAKANGMFLLASLKLWELEHDVASKGDVRKVLASIPASLDDAYHQIFERIGAQGDRKKKLALRTIMWIYASSKFHTTLKYPVLGFLLACEISTSEPEFQEDRRPHFRAIMNACGGLLQTPRDREHWKKTPKGFSIETQAARVYAEIHTRFAFIHYSAHEYLSRNESFILPEDPYVFAFNISTIALRHIERLQRFYHAHLQKQWLATASFMDRTQPAVVQSAFADTHFNESAAAMGGGRLGRSLIMSSDSDSDACEMGTHVVRKPVIDNYNQTMRLILPPPPLQIKIEPWPKWLISLVSKRDSDLNSLEYAALFGLRGTFRLARETGIVDKHHRTVEILVTCGHNCWDLVKEVWECGEYDINAYCEKFGSTFVCGLLSGRYTCSASVAEDLSRAFLQHPSTSLCCSRHDKLLGCAINGYDGWNLAKIGIILERLYRDAKDGRSQPGRISVYPPPTRTRPHPPDILDVIAVVLQEADIDLDADITQMVPPEILLALLMLPWHPDSGFYIKEEAEDVLRPYARRPVDVPDTNTSNHVPDADALADYVVPDTARAVEAMDTCATAEAGVADSTPAHIPSGEVLDDPVVPGTARALEAVDTYCMTAVLLVVGAAIVLYLSVAPSALSPLSIQQYYMAT